MHNAKSAVELAPDRDSPDKLGRGAIKRVCVPNSWAGDYGRYATLLTKAQEFFAQSNPGHPRRPHPLAARAAAVSAGARAR